MHGQKNIKLSKIMFKVKSLLHSKHPVSVLQIPSG